MAHQFDVTNPEDNDLISEYPTNERAERTTVKNVVTEEHDEGSGHHKLMIDTETNRDLVTDWVNGSLVITTDTVTGQYVLEFTTDGGSTWKTTLDAFLNNSNDWVKGQIFTPKAITSSSGHIASDWRDGNIFTITLDEDTTLDNPTLTGFSSKSAVRYYVITQDSTARALSFGGLFIGDNKTISSVVNSVNVYECVLDAAGNIQTTLLNAPFATDAEAAAGTETARALTPANLAQNIFGDDDQGGFELVGLNKLVQWTRGSVTTGGTLTFATAFADANYAFDGIPFTSTSTHLSAVATDESTVTCYPRDDNGNGVTRDVGIIAIGNKPS